MNQEEIKKQFPIFQRTINGRPLTYLDNASTTQKPICVLEAIRSFYEMKNANIHRGIHTLSEEATIAYEATRKRISNFIHAKNPEEIVFTKNCTESLNLVAYSWGCQNISEGDEIIVSVLEHHSNLVPWQELTQRKKAILKVIPLAMDYTLDMDAYDSILSSRTKLVCVTGMSNVFGTTPPVNVIIQKAHTVGARVCIDGAQMVPHLPIHAQNLDCDFLAFSSHKMCGPTGVGVLYGKKELLDSMPPFLFGGDMITTVEQYSAFYREAPWKFEAGTPNIADVIAFASSIEFLESIGMDAIRKHGHDLLAYAKELFSQYPSVKLYSPSDGVTGGILSFTVKGVHPHDIASIFDSEGIAIRSGVHCAEPLMRYLEIPATARMSFYMYNTREDIEIAEKALRKVFSVFNVI